MARKGLINDEAISAYIKYKEEERRQYLEVMTELNPDYAFKVGDQLLSLDIPKEELPAGLTRDQFLEKVKGKVLNMTSLVSTYRRPQ